MSALSKPYFHNEDAAFAHVESIIWAKGVTCPHCGGYDRIYDLKGKTTRQGLKKCGQCRKPFTVRVGTIFESSHAPLHKWLLAIYLMTSSKKGISSHQLSRALEVTYKTAWFMAHRLREAMRTGALSPFGTGGGSVEVDETYIGKNPDGADSKKSTSKMNAVLTLVDRESGQAKSQVIDTLTIAEITPILTDNMAKEARLLTDRAQFYKQPGKLFSAHESVNHNEDEWVRKDDRTIHTNTVEGFFSVFKRGMKGIYQHCAKRHLNRYLAEFDFRYNHRVALGHNDADRQQALLCGIVGKRLMYRQVRPLNV